MIARTLAAGAALLSASAAWADPPAHPPPLEPETAANPLEFDVVYTADVWRAEGGVGQGWRYLDNVDVTLAADLEQLAGITGTRAFAYVLYNNGKSLSELNGDAFVASNIETGVRALRLYEAWIEHDFAPGASLRAGLYDLNSEFDALETSSLFIGSAHGIGPDISQSGANGPSIFPVTSLAARLAVEVVPGATVRAAVLDAVPGDPAHPARTAIILGEGALGIVEGDVAFGAARVIGGAWRYSEGQPRIDGTGVSASQGAYLRGETCLSGGADCALNGFVRAGIASGATNPFSGFLAAGLTLALGEATLAGIAIAHGIAGKPQRRADPDFRDETVIEATVAHRLAPWLTVQPNLQLIRRSSAAGDRSAQALGLRVTFEPLRF